MTTILAAKTDKGKIHFAWDTQTTAGHKAINGGDKVFVNGGVVFGVSGTVRTADVLQYMKVPKRTKADGDTRKWIITKLVPAIISEMKRVDAAYMENGQANTESSTIIAVDDVIGYLGSDLSFVEDALGLYGVGSGSSFAMGAFLGGASLTEAVQVAGILDVYTNMDVRTAKASKLVKAASKGE